MKFLKFPHESYLVKIQTQTSFSFFPSCAESLSNVRRFPLSSEAQRGSLDLYMSNVSLLYFSSKNRGSAPSPCKASPNVSKTPKSLRTSSLHSLKPLTKRNPPKTSYKILPPWFHRVLLLRKRSPFKFDFFSSFIVPDLQTSSHQSLFVFLSFKLWKELQSVSESASPLTPLLIFHGSWLS